MLKLFLISSFLGALSNLIQAPWNFFLLIFLIFPILHLILDSKIKDQSYLQRFISLLLILGGFLYFYFQFGFSWIISAFEFRPELSSFKFITLFGLPLLMIIFVSPSFVIPTIFWDTRVNKILSLASCISIGEFLRGNIFTGFSWNNFSHSLAINENLMQIFSITGQYLATFFLIVTSQFILFFCKDRAYFKALIFISLLPVIFLYGSIRIKDNEFIDTNLIGVVQPNVLQKDKINNPDGYEILRNLIDLSNKKDANFLIWPESSIPILLQHNPEVVELIIDNLPKESEILIGNITFQEDKFRNSALLIDQDKKIRDIYHKVHLVPFG